MGLARYKLAGNKAEQASCLCFLKCVAPMFVVPKQTANFIAKIDKRINYCFYYE